MNPERPGVIRHISGPTVRAIGLVGTRLFNRVRVGSAGLLGEVVRIQSDACMIQVYEDTTGLSIGEPVVDTGGPLTVELGPGLLSAIFDGVQRPLLGIAERSGPYIPRGDASTALSHTRKWVFQARANRGNVVIAGDLLGVVPSETGGLEHRVLVPPGQEGILTELFEGDRTIDEPIAILNRVQPLTLLQHWPVRTARPFKKRIPLSIPFLTGQRVIDTLFPLALGGSVILPGGFGTGKTVLEQALAKHSHADVVIYIGCGERGNEMTEVLREFPNLVDPKSGRSLMDRTILVVNTSNMPVAAREASIYTGITLAEYYRDMGYHVAVMADSTSRWAEALREISARMEEMPGEEGYPSTLGSRLSHFYERAGRVYCLGSEQREGSVTLCAAVSPPGGDYSEPVTQSSMRLSGALWGLDFGLAHQRHYPAIHWSKSYSVYTPGLDAWFRNEVSTEWPDCRKRLFHLLQREEEIRDVAQLVGTDALQEGEKMILEFARLVREYYLRQNALDPLDASCPIQKQYWILKYFFWAQEDFERRLKDGSVFSELPWAACAKTMALLREAPPEDVPEKVRSIVDLSPCS